jgi:hypothetical protein
MCDLHTRRTGDGSGVTGLNSTVALAQMPCMSSSIIMIRMRLQCVESAGLICSSPRADQARHMARACGQPRRRKFLDRACTKGPHLLH